MNRHTLKQFVGNPNAYAVQQPDGSYRPYRAPLDDAVLDEHIAGNMTVGTYVLDIDKARFMVFDIDDGDRQLADRIATFTRTLGFAPGVEESGRKGFHVWVLLPGWEPGDLVRRAAKGIAYATGFTGEVFPKQAVARDLGNLVKLPFGIHQVTGKRSRFGKVPGVSVLGRLGEAAALCKDAPPPAHAKLVSVLPCLDSIQTNPPQEGQRHTLLFHFACHLRRMGLHDEAVEAVLETLVNSADLNPGEMQNIVQGSEFSGPLCDQLEQYPERHCPPELCIKTRSTVLGVRPGQLRHAADGSLVVLKVGKREKDSNTLPLEHPDVSAAAVALREEDKYVG